MGTKSTKRAKTRLDAYYRLAKDQGYRSRAAFKLIQLNRKYDFLSKSKNLVDLCAAPGGWLQVAAKYMPVGSKILGCDLAPIAPIKGTKTFVGDITEEKTRKTINQYLKKEPVDIVVHDGAPNVGGVWAKDLFAQNSLVLSALKLAVSVLRPGGWFVTKVFRSPDFQKLIWVFKQFFDKVEATKPLASRMESAEIFVVCNGFKAPKQVDQKLFAAQHVFSDVGEEKVLNQAGVLVVPKSHVPVGYDEFSTVIHRVATMSDFLKCDDPKAFLKHFHEIRFAENERHFLDSKWSKKELLYLCHDLQQVGDADRRRLMRWREQLLREEAKRRLERSLLGGGAAGTLGGEAEGAAEVEGSDAESNAAANGEVAPAKPEDDIRKMTAELLEIRKARAKEIKKKQKKLVDAKLHQIRGLINYDPHESAEHPTNMGDDEFAGGSGGSDEEDEGKGIADNDWTLGRLRDVPEEAMAAMFDKHYVEPDTGLNVTFDAVQTVQPDDDEEIDIGSAGDEMEMADAAREEAEAVGADMDVDNWGNLVPAERAPGVALFDRAEDDRDADDENNEGEEKEPMTEKQQARHEKDEEELDAAGKQSKWQRRHLNIEKVLNRTFPKVRDSKKRKRNTEEELIEMKNTTDEGDRDAHAAARRRLEEGRLRDEESGTDSASGDADLESVSSFGASEGSLNEELGQFERTGREDSRRKKQMVPSMKKLTAAEMTKTQRKQVLKQQRAAEKQKTARGKKKKGDKEDTSFEVIPIAMTDPDVRARTLAIATKMLEKRSRREILDNAINRFTHNDDDDLPEWFIKDEQRNCKIDLPITAAEIEAQRERFREMSSRPSKKIAEAIGRKRRKAQRMLHGLVEKGRTDPRARAKTVGLSVRKLMRSKSIKGDTSKKKKGPVDARARGQAKRERQRVQRDKKGRKR